MISILIPTYNYNIVPLVKELHKQCIDCKISFEIICIDDGSKSPLNTINEKINSFCNCKFISKKVNVGLSNNRNALANLSQFEILLFIDGDSLLPDNKFIERYHNAISLNTDIVYGGTIYPLEVKENKKLRWKYGILREGLNASERKKNKYKCVMFNNTLIKKLVFEKIRFEKNIIQYGYEDTVFAFKAKQIQASILHIDNPVLHNDVDLNEVFITKTKKALENLNSIYQTKIIDPNFITFLKLFTKLKSYKFNYLLSSSYKVFYRFFKWQLTSKQPSLFVFNFFRLSYFCHINLKK